MKKLLLVLAVLMIGTSLALAAGPKTYQVTGPVLEIKDNIITVEKGKEKWEIAKDAATKVTGDLKVGSKVTIEYTMKATAVEVKDAGKKAEPAKSEPAPAQAQPKN